MRGSPSDAARVPTSVRSPRIWAGRSASPAHLAALRRTEASGFTAEEALTLAQAEALAPDALRARLIPMGDALRVLPSVSVTWDEARDLVHGRALRREAPDAQVRALAPDGRLVAICAPGERGLSPRRVLLAASELGRAGAEDR